MGKRLEIKVGEKHNRITLLEEVEPHITPCGTKQRQVKCLCECGREFIACLYNILNEHTKSCGCLSKEMSADKIRKAQKIWVSQASHTQELYPELYRILGAAIQRCTNPNRPEYKDYGGRGICVCDEWRNDRKKFIEFALANGWEPGLELDREDNDGDYSPENCRFVSRSVNLNNRRNTLRTVDGVPVADIYNTANYRAVSYSCFSKRIRAGWDVSAALTTKSRKWRRSNG